VESSTLVAPAAEVVRRAHRHWALRPLIRLGGPIAYLVALGLTCAFVGLPTSRDAFFFWVLVGLLASSLTNIRGWFRGLVLDWLPFGAVLFAYDLLRGYADALFSAHVWPQLRADELLDGGPVPTVWLQQRLWDPRHIDWIDYAAWSVYLTHFFATLLVAAILWLAASHLFRRFAACVVFLAVAGLSTYVLFPAVPPWMASEEGYLPHTERVVGIVSHAAPIGHFGSLWEHGTRYANDVAAMPSLHAAYAMLIALFFVPRVRWPWRIPLAAYPLAMAFALVYTGEHYVSDVLLGWLYAVVAVTVVELVARRRAPARA
jgi:membrane-associated phospholipid phosphatase